MVLFEVILSDVILLPVVGDRKFKSEVVITRCSIAEQRQMSSKLPIQWVVNGRGMEGG